MKKQIYLAMRFAKLEDYKNKLLELKDLGFEISHDWSSQKSIKPYEDNLELAQQFTLEDVAGVKNADIFILIAEKEKDARGCNMEFGIALANHDKYEQIIVLNESRDDAMFYFHPKVKLLRSWGEVLQELKS
jgi:hypothetical protein